VPACYELTLSVQPQLELSHTSLNKYCAHQRTSHRSSSARRAAATSLPHTCLSSRASSGSASDVLSASDHPSLLLLLAVPLVVLLLLLSGSCCCCCRCAMRARWAAMSNGNRWAMTAGSAASALVSHSALRSVLSRVTRCGSLPVCVQRVCSIMQCVSSVLVTVC
jgi:hypothetical protein